MPLWIPVLLLGTVLAAGLRAMERKARAEGYGWIDPGALVFRDLPGWVDPRWEDELAECLAEVPAFRTDDGVGADRLEASLRELSFVRSAAVTQIQWPDGVSVALELREPIACLPVGRHFLPVSEEGVVLPGFWTLPPRVEGRLLPVIGPMADAYGAFAAARAGDWLVEPRHVDALAIALSAREHLTDSEAGRMGRFVVDAARARAGDPDGTGAVLLFDGPRRILFGRAPANVSLGLTDEPGELPVAAKWDSVRRALALLESGGGSPVAPSGDWEEVDVRWDQPTIVLSRATLVALAEERAAEREEDAATEAVRDLPRERATRVYEAPAPPGRAPKDSRRVR